MPGGHRWWGLLLVSLLAGCASTRAVRLDTGEGRPLEYVPPTSDRSVTVAEDAFEEALAKLVLELPLSLQPAEAGWLVRASTRGATTDKVLQGALRQRYVRWCRAHEGPGDCLSLLEDGLGFDSRKRLALALGLSLEPMHESIADAVERTLNPTFFKAVVVSALVSWVVLAAAPEPLFTKAAALVAVLMLGYLGIDSFLAVVAACRELVSASDRATTFQELEAAGERFGRRVGLKGARIFILAVALMVGRGTVGSAAWMSSRLPVLPDFPAAAALSASQLGVNLAAAEQVRAVAVVQGRVAFTLAPNAVAMVGTGSDGIPGDPDGKIHHICTDKNDVSDANGGPWTPLFEKFFKKAGMSIQNDPANQVRIRGHEGPHPEAYHREVFRRIDEAMVGCRGMTQCREALIQELGKLSKELLTPGSMLRRLVTKDKD